MTLHRHWLALCAAMVFGTVAAEPAVYTIDPERSVVHFEVLHFGTSTVRGRVGPVRGSVTLDRSAGRGEVQLQVSTAALDTGVRPFDARLREPDLLASAEFPVAYFVATQLRFDGANLAEVSGEFTLRGVSKALSLRAIRFACRPGIRPDARPDAGADAGAKGEVCGGDFEGHFQRSDFGMNFGLPFVADRVRLFVAVQGRRWPG